jgi:hypothetical protein
MGTTISKPVSSATIQDEGNGQVVLTCVMPKAVASDLASQLESKVICPETNPRSGVRGRYRQAYKAICETIRGFASH